MNHLNKKAGLVVGVGVASIVMIGSSAAYAAGTVVSVNGVKTVGNVAVSGDNTTPVGFETNFGVPMTCADSDIDGTIKRGAAVSGGTTVGTIDSLTLSNCLATTLNFPVTATMSGQNIKVQAGTNVSAGAPIPVDIEVDATVSGTGCNFTATGSVQGVINPGSGSPDGTIVLQNGFDLVIDTAGGSPTGSSCGGEVVAGDLAQATGGDFDLTTSGTGAGAINHS